MTNEEAINRLGLDIDMVQFDPITGGDRYVSNDERTLIEAQRMGIKALKAQNVGKWQAKDFHTVFCSECEFEVDIMTTPDDLLNHLNHCPNCGARMEGQE